MKIRELSINNYLSFSDKGLNESNSIELGDFNLLIGSNNAGKSNVLKLTELLKSVLESVRKQGNSNLRDIPLSFPGEQGDWIFAQDLTKKISFSFSLEIDQADGIIQDYDHLKEKNPVWFMFKFKDGWPKVFKGTAVIEYRQNSPFATVTKVEIPNDHRAYREDPVLFDRDNNKILALRPGSFRDEQVWKVLSLRNNENQWRSDYASVGNATLPFLYQLYDRIFKDLLINIHAIREIKETGDEVSEALTNLKEGRQDQRRMFDSVQEFINELIFNNEGQGTEFRFPGNTGKKRMEIAVGGLVLPLGHYGSAVEQMLVLAAEIVRHGSNKVFLIEEPEAHFYPDLQKKFIRFLKDNQETFKHQYLIATHSSTFINEFFNMNGNVFQVRCEQDNEAEPKYSQVEPFDKAKLPILFKALGIRPADLLLANGILVVEGPTDKDVYTDWARKIEKPFEAISLEVIDVEGAGNIKKYLLSNIIQKSCFQRYALHDKNAKEIVRKAVAGIVPKENTISLEKGDIEDYYPRELVLEFVKEWGEIRKAKKEEIPSEIKEGETVQTLRKFLKGRKDWWKRNLADKIIKEMKPEQIDDEVKNRLTEIYEAIY